MGVKDMWIAGREIGAYELMHGGGARWYWDARYVTEAETAKMQEPLSPSLLAEIDVALARRCAEWKQEYTSEIKTYEESI